MKLNEVRERKASDLDIVYHYGDLSIAFYRLTSLEGCPKTITGDLRCHSNLLTSLEGCPEKIPGSLGCADNLLNSFEHFPKYIGATCSISDNKFTSFKDIDQHIEFIGNEMFASDMNITSGFSDLFGVNGLQYIEIDNKEIEKIVNKYLPDKDLIEFQDEMIKSGYESYL